VAAVHPVKPLPQLQPIAQQPELPQQPSVAPAASTSAMLAAAEASVLAVPDLTVSGQTLGQPNAPPSPEEQWLARVIAQLERYKSRPRSAMKRHQQDTGNAAPLAYFSRCTPPTFARSRSKVPSGRWPALRAISTTRHSEKPSGGRLRKLSSAAVTTSAS
ncbi:MAG: hypothetical protein ACREUT_12375, partial [Steroidobacteraceae bacterium]